MAMVVVVVVVGVIRWLLRALRFPTWVGVIGTLCESSRLRRAAFRPRMLSEKAATGSFTMACWKTKLMLLLRICSTTGAVLFSLFTLISIFKNLVSVNKILYFVLTKSYTLSLTGDKPRRSSKSRSRQLEELGIRI